MVTGSWRASDLKNRIRETWAENRPVVNGWLSIPSTVTAEINARAGFDSLTVDLQHGLNDYQSALNLLQIISIGKSAPLARVPWLEPGIVGKLLDAGAVGLICPMINSAEDAARLVRYALYAPTGERSFGPTRAIMAHGPDYAQTANEQIVTLAMVETKQALNELDGIVATSGLTGVYIGPSDLSLSMGYTPKLDPDEPAVVSAIQRILETAKTAGIRAGIHCLSPAYAREMISMGFDLVTVGSDVRLLTSATAAALEAVRS